MKVFFHEKTKIFTKFKKFNQQLCLLVLAIMSLSLPIISFTALGISSQYQVQQLEAVPDELDNTISKALHGKDSPYYKIFIISLDWSFLFKNKKADVDSGTESFGKLLLKLQEFIYEKQPFVLSDEEQAAFNVGMGWWSLIKETIVTKLVNHHTLGLSYFWNNFTHGTSLPQLLSTKSSQTSVIDKDLKEILTKYHNIGAYNSINTIKAFGKGVDAPVVPETFTVHTPALIPLKIATIGLFIISPILVGITLIYYLIIRYRVLLVKLQTMFKTKNKAQIQGVEEPEITSEPEAIAG